MSCSRMTILAAVLAFAAAAVVPTAFAGAEKGEPRFQGSFPSSPTASVPRTHRPTAAELSLIRVGARTSEPAVVQQGLTHRATPPSAASATPAAPASHAFDWTWIAIAALATAGLILIGGYALARRAHRLDKPSAASV